MVTLTQTAPGAPTPYFSAPALRAPQMVLTTATVQPPTLAGSSQVSSARLQSAQSSAQPSDQPLVAPNMANRTPSEQAVVQDLQAVANYPESRDFVETVSRTLSGLQTLLDVPLQPKSCMSSRQSPGPRTAAPGALPPVSTLSPISEEAPGRETTSPYELAGAMSQ